MIKLSASVGKKTPIPGQDYSSRQCGAGMEIEVSDTADPREVAEKLARMHETLERAVDAQMGSDPARPGQGQPLRRPSNGGGGNGQRSGGASEAQVKAVFAIGKDRGLSRDEIVQILQGEFAVDRPGDLDVRQASDLIGMLQRMERIRR